MAAKKLETPITLDEIERLRSGEAVSLSGVLIAARDAAHKRIVSSLESNQPLPFDLKDRMVFYLGPSPVPPGKTSGSIGPTTSARMDGLTEPLLKAGVHAFIGKGRRSDHIKVLLQKYKAVYLVAPGGVAAFLGQKVKRIETVAYSDLGPEAVYELEVEDFPLVVAYDIYGGDIFTSPV
jgi:fumarate hydratase subunit beta